MKKRLSILFFLTFCVAALTFGQVPRNLVVIEMSTGTWCPFCPGAALAVEDFLNNGQDIAAIEHHGGDSYQTTASMARINYYGITGYPTTVFDGVNQYGGGNATTSIYPSLLPLYNQAINVPSPLSMEMFWTSDGTNFTATVKASLQTALPGGVNPVIHFALTESHVQQNWQGLTELNDINRLMLPNENGTPVNLTVGGTDSVVHTFQLGPGWVQANCEIIAFVQDPVSKTIYNGIKMSLNGPTAALDAALTSFTNQIPSQLCEDMDVTPEIQLTNNGGDILTSAAIVYSVNGEPAQTYNWTGNLLWGQSTTVTLPTLNYTPLANNELMINVAAPNGGTDEQAANNQLMTEWTFPIFANGNYQLLIQPDVNGAEITWQVIDELDGSVAASGGPYVNGQIGLIVQQFSLGTHTGCYTMKMYDAGGDGLQEVNTGYYELRDKNGQLVATSPDGAYGAEHITHFNIDFASAIDELPEGSVTVYPNPNQGLFTVDMQDFVNEAVDVTIYQMNGAELMHVNTMEGMYQFDLTDQPAGVYLLKVRTESGISVHKIAKD